MPDDLDDRIRAAMKVLDGETPSGYFDAAPNQILARLEDGSMQHGTGTSGIGNKRDMNALVGAALTPEDADTNPTPRVEASDVGPLPTKPVEAKPVEAKPAKADRDEDSGLHDIRNLAQSTKQRLSAKRITQNPPNRDDDVLASSSGSFANIALPQPAKMVSLPELEDLPSKQEIIAAQKAAAKARKEKKPTVEPMIASRDSGVLAPQAQANAALAAMSAAPVAAASAADIPAASTSASALPVRQAFTLPSMERKKSKGPIIAVLGLGVAAAAGGLIFMNSKDDKKSSAQVASAEQVPAKADPAPVAAAAAGSAAETAPTPPPAVEEPAKPAEPAVAAADSGADDKDDDNKGKRRGAAKAAKKDTDDDKKVVEETKTETKVEPPKDTAKEIKTPDGTKKANTGEGEPSFDALLKEAGVEEKKDAKPKLEKKSLSGDDFKKGMAAVQAKAQGCYKGTQGTASVKLTVGPDGKVSKVTVAGQFAGSAEGTCVQNAVKSATFPAWDGGPQSFNYSYMLAD